MRPERKLWKWLAGVLPAGHYSRIETGATSPGFPDIYFTLEDYYQSGTIELKACEKLKDIPFPDEDSGLHKSQKIWIRNEIRAGGIVWIIAQVMDTVFFIPGEEYSRFNGATITDLTSMSRMTVNKELEPSEYTAERLLQLLIRRRR